MMLLISFLLTFSSFASDDEKWAGNDSMNGIRFDTYKNFSREWKQVTVRYRQDTGEFRYTYANALAYEALKKKKDYPEGAVFIKVGHRLAPDPAFPSSLIPQKIARYQVMKRDPKSKATGGWTYALFDENERTFPGEPQEVAVSCHSCHELVKDKHFVFSEILSQEKGETSRPLASASKLTFVRKKINELPPAIIQRLPPGTKEVSFLTGPLRKHVFDGTLDEIKPALAEEVVRQKIPALFLSEDLKRYSLVLSDQSTKCEASELGIVYALKVFFTISPRAHELPPNLLNKEGIFASKPFCYLQLK